MTAHTKTNTHAPVRRRTGPVALMVLVAAGLAVSAFTLPAQAAGNKVDALVKRMTPDETLQMADLLTLCGGVYAAFSEFSIQHQPELGQQYRELEREALLAGAYLLYREHRLRTGKTRPIQDFAPAVKARAQVSAAEARAAFAAQDLDKSQQLLTDCGQLEELQMFLAKSLQAEMPAK